MKNSKNTNLTQGQMIALSTLVYLNSDKWKTASSVAEIIDWMLHKNELDKTGNPKLKEDEFGRYDGGMSRDEWITLLNTIKNDDTLMNLKILHYESEDPNGDRKEEFKAMMFVSDVNDKSNATVVFRGTFTDKEWFDNAQIGYFSDTPLQMRGNGYIRKLIRAGYTDLNLCGHSKGGNTAQYCAILNDEVKYAFSVDGPGFSQRFIDQYSDKIVKNQNKLFKVSNKSDYVNPMFYTFGSNVHLDTGKNYVGNDFIKHHCPNILIDSSGNLKPVAEPDFHYYVLNSLTSMASSEISITDMRIMTHFVMNQLQQEGKLKEADFWNLVGKTLINSPVVLAGLLDGVDRFNKSRIEKIENLLKSKSEMLKQEYEPLIKELEYRKNLSKDNRVSAIREIISNAIKKDSLTINEISSIANKIYYYCVKYWNDEKMFAQKIFELKKEYNIKLINETLDLTLELENHIEKNKDFYSKMGQLWSEIKNILGPIVNDAITDRIKNANLEYDNFSYYHMNKNSPKVNFDALNKITNDISNHIIESIKEADLEYDNFSYYHFNKTEHKLDFDIIYNMLFMNGLYTDFKNNIKFYLEKIDSDISKKIENHNNSIYYFHDKKEKQFFDDLVSFYQANADDDGSTLWEILQSIVNYDKRFLDFFVEGYFKSKFLNLNAIKNIFQKNIIKYRGILEKNKTSLDENNYSKLEAYFLDLGGELKRIIGNINLGKNLDLEEISKLMSSFNSNMSKLIEVLPSNIQSDVSQLLNQLNSMKEEFLEVLASIYGVTHFLKILQQLLLFNFDSDKWSQLQAEYDKTSKLRVDPLVLDLDGDGLETTDVKTGVHFDLDNNGFMEKTAWISSDDGILVMDRNKDGKINSGAELFGDRTILKNGRVANSGFEALADLDDNKDRKIDEKDSDFKNLRVWRDLNQDGKAVDSELFDLKTLGIKALNLDKTAKNQTLENGNIHRNSGSYEKEDGTKLSIGEFLLDRDTLNSRKDNLVSLSEEIRNLPNVMGKGNLYSLRQAMQRDESGVLKNILKEILAEKDPKVRFELVEKLLFAWAGASDIEPKSRGLYIDARKLVVIERFMGTDFLGQNGKNPIEQAAQRLLKIYENIYNYVYATIGRQSFSKEIFGLLQLSLGEDNQLKINLTSVKEYLIHQLDTQEEKGIESLIEFSRLIKGMKQENNSEFLKLKEDFYRKNLKYGLEIDQVIKKVISVSNQVFSINGTYEDELILGNELDNTIHGDLGDDTIVSVNGSDVIDAGSGNDILVGGKAEDYLKGGFGADTYVFRKGDGKDVIHENGKAYENGLPTEVDKILFKDINKEDIVLTRRNENKDLVIRIKDSEDEIVLKDVDYSYYSWYVYYQNTNTIEEFHFANGEVLSYEQLLDLGLEYHGDENDNTITGYSMSDTIYGYEGNDTIYADAGKDTVYGGGGDDKIFSRDDNDLIYGEKGDDYLEGGLGADTYVFRKGDGKDVIHENGKAYENGLPTEVDKILFKDINKEDIVLTRRNENKDLVIRIKDSEDEIVLKDVDYSYYSWNVYYQNRNTIEEFHFANGEVLSYEQLLALGLEYHGDESDNTIAGYSMNDTIYGYGGNDIIYSDSGNDIIYSGDGNDDINSGSGEDIIYSGQGNDTVRGDEGNDQICAEKGDDKLYGGYGDDLLEGDKGDDYLEGGYGADTYVFKKGDGKDVIHENGKAYENGLPTEVDKILFKDINKEDIVLTRRNENKDLVIKIKSSEDEIVLKDVDYSYYSWNVYYQNRNTIEEFHFANGEVLNYEQLLYLGLEYHGDENDNTLTGHSTNDTIYGYGGNDTIYSNAGDDSIYAGEGNDMVYAGNENDSIYGQEGDDKLYGETGNDILEGGKGNDYLQGGYGGDTYVFSRGDGKDVISERGNSYQDGKTNEIDKIVFKDINREDIRLTRRDNNKDLVIQIKGSEDEITLKDVDYYLHTWDFKSEKSNWIEEFHFANGETLSYEELLKMGLEYHGDENDNTLTGHSTNDTIYGYDGNDVIDSRDGNDKIYGQDGDDKIQAGIGDDILIGGKGDDYLDGSYGNDTYVYSKGDGKDIISDYDSNSSNKDRLELQVDMLNTIFKREGNNLSIEFADSESDSIKVQNWNYGSNYQIEEIDANGYEITNLKVNLLIDAMSAFSIKTGIDWKDAVNQKNEEAITILNQFWVKDQQA